MAIGLPTALLLAAVGISACTNWSSVPSIPDSAPPQPLRLTLADSSHVELENAVAVSDTLRGLSHGDSVAIPLSEVEDIERRGGVRTTVVFAAVSVVLLVAFGIASSN
jgi:hypothetical protein